MPSTCIRVTIFYQRHAKDAGRFRSSPVLHHPSSEHQARRSQKCRDIGRVFFQVTGPSGLWQCPFSAIKLFVLPGHWKSGDVGEFRNNRPEALA